MADKSNSPNQLLDHILSRVVHYYDSDYESATIHEMVWGTSNWSEHTISKWKVLQDYLSA